MLHKPSRNTIWIIGGSATFLMLLILAGWFFFLNKEQNSISEVFEGRSFGSDIPSFEGNIGSTNKNIREGLLETFGFSLKKPDDTDKNVIQTPRLWQISSVPAAGITAVGTSSPPRLQFVERPSGNIFEADTKTGDVIRISNTLVPSSYRALWAGSGHVLLQHLDDKENILTFSGEVLAGATADDVGELSGKYLEPDTVSVASSPQVDDIFYLVHTTNGIAGLRANSDGSEPNRVFSSALRDWRSKQVGDVILLVQNASEGITGSAYTLSQSEELRQRVINTEGLTIEINPTDTAYIYGETHRGSIKLFSKTDDASSTHKLSLSTFADKCVFDPSQEFIAYCAVPNSVPSVSMPDAWYRGEVHFSDSWWKINVEDGTVEQVFSPESEFRVRVDVLDPKMNEDGTHIFFLDAKTRTPWAFRIKK